MKRILSIFLVLVLCFCICFQCSLSSQAVFGVDDVILCGVLLDLVACGVTVYSVSQFVQSDTFHDFTQYVGEHIENQISIVKRNGELFYATTKLGWSMITNWVKSHFSGANETKTIQFDTELSASPEFLICADGSTLPYEEWMEYPFFIYNSTQTQGRKWAYWVTQQNAGMVVQTYSVQIFCAPKATVMWGYFENGSFHANGQYNRMQDQFYKGQAGGYQQIDFNHDMHPNQESWYQYRSIEIIVNNDTGVINPNYSPAQNPSVGQPGTASVEMHSDAAKYPGAIDAPADTIKDGEKVLVKVPADMVVDDGNGNLTVTTDAAVVGDAIAETTVADVEPRVLTDTSSEGVDTVVNDVIADTPAHEIGGSNPTADIETANKFKLPKSFLEGFPFSIPYSVFVGIKSFVAEAQAPVFNIPFSIPRLGISETLTLDLNQFNPVAKLCRALLSVVWVAGLAMAASKFIKR